MISYMANNIYMESALSLDFVYNNSLETEVGKKEVEA